MNQRHFHLVKLSKYLLLFSFLIALPCMMSAQRKSNKKPKKYFTAQLGVYQDFGKNDLSDNYYDLSHFDFKKIGFGMLQYKEQRASQFLVEFSGYEEIFGLTYYEVMPGVYSAIRGIERQSILLEVEYFRSVLDRVTFENNFHFGYTLNSSFQRVDDTPFVTNQYPITESCICLGAGIKAMYVLSISKKAMLVFSSDVNIFDFGLIFNYNGNPNIFVKEQRQRYYEFDMLRNRVGLDIGIVFEL